MNSKTVLLEMKTSLKSIIRKTTIPLSILLLIIGVLMEVYLYFSYGVDTNRTIINLFISITLVVIISVAATNRIHKLTYIRVYDDYLEINDMSKSYLRNIKIKISDIKNIEVIKDNLVIETEEKFRLMHLSDPYQVVKLVKSIKKES